MYIKIIAINVYYIFVIHICCNDFFVVTKKTKTFILQGVQYYINFSYASNFCCGLNSLFIFLNSEFM